MKAFMFLAVLLPLKLLSQTDTLPKNAEGKYEYTDVVNVDSASAEKLYSNAKMFVALTFKSGKDVTQLNDDAGKTVIGKDKSYFDKNKTSRRFFQSISDQVSVDMKSLVTRLNTFMSSENKKTKDW